MSASEEGSKLLIRGSRVAAALAVLILLAAGSTRAVPGASAHGDTQGDVTCDSAVNSVDSLQILRDVAGLETSAGCLAAAGDVNCDSALNSVDALRILRYVAGLPPITPEGCAPIGDPVEPPPTSEELIAAALGAGDIDYETSLLYRAYALTDDPQLPAEYRSPVVDVEAGMQLFGEVDKNEGALSQGLLDKLTPWRVRPADPASIFNNPPGARAVAPQAAPVWVNVVTAGGKVRIWEKDGPSTADDFIFLKTRVASVWDKITNLLGEPNADTAGDPSVNPDGAIDLYFVHYGDVDPRWVCNNPLDPCDQAMLSSILPGGTYRARPFTFEGALTSSAYGVVELDLMSPDLIPVTAEVLAFAAEFAYDTYESEWLMRTTSDWAAVRVLEMLNGDRSPFYPRLLVDIFHRPEEALTRKPGHMGVWGQWLYLFFASMEKGDGIIKEIWQKAAAYDQQGANAVDQAFPFADHFADFALRNVNQKPPLLKAYKDKDDTFPAYQPDQEGIEIIAPGTDPVPAALVPLSARYYAISPLEPTVRTIRFDNKAYLTPDLHIWALVQIKGEWQEPEDWTRVAKKEFCRDDPEQDVTQIILAVSNASMTVPTAPAHNPEIVSESIGCNGWAGTMTATETWTGYAQEQTGKATATFSGRWEIADATVIGGMAGCPVADPIHDPPCVTYLPTGTISWTWDSHNTWFPSCDETRAGSQPAGPVLFPWDQILQFVPLKLGTIQYYEYWGHSNWRVDQDLQCAGPEGEHQPPGFFEISASEDPQPGDPGGNTCFLADRLYLGFEQTLTGSCYQWNYAPPEFHQHSLQYEWNLHAVGNPTGN